MTRVLHAHGKASDNFKDRNEFLFLKLCLPLTPTMKLHALEVTVIRELSGLSKCFTSTSIGSALCLSPHPHFHVSHLPSLLYMLVPRPHPQGLHPISFNGVGLRAKSEPWDHGILAVESRNAQPPKFPGSGL